MSVGFITRLPSHSAQVKETRSSLCDSQSGVKKMAVGHHHGECSHTIEQKSKLALKGEGGEAGLCQLGGRRVRVGLEPESGGGCLGQKTSAHLHYSAIFRSSQVGCGMVCSV